MSGVPATPPKPRCWLGVAAAALAIGAAAVLAWLSTRGVVVEAVTVQEAPLLRTVQFSARVATLSRVEVGSTITGRVSQVMVDEGDAVRQGDVLLRLESAELRAALAQAEAGEEQARAQLAGLRSTGRAAASASVAQAEASLRAAGAELARTGELVKQGFLSASRMDEARRAMEVARAQRDGAMAQVQAVQEAGADLVQARAQLAVAQAASGAARARLAQATVHAPADARVLSRDVEPGQIVQPGKALMALALAGPTQIKAQMDERFLDQLRPGQVAAVVADAFPTQRFGATVLSIAPAVDAQRGAVEVRFSMNEAAPAFLREDMSLSVEVETGRRERALVLPLAALRHDAAGARPDEDAAAAVMVLTDGRARRRVVRLGLRTLDAAEVREGLSAGDVVLLGEGVEEGQRVRVGRAARAAATSGAGAALVNAIGH